MIAITTKYLSPTNNRGSRIKAYAKPFNVTIPYDYSLSDEKLHFKAVKELVKKHNLNWDISNMNYGSTENGYVFTFNHSTIEG
tara:strand:+ start:55 stop:303 length:249 start_codon:yes stop_codon:yes gene_type:complete